MPTTLLSDSSWKRRGDVGAGVVYERPLGTTEFCFYWDGVFQGTADTLQHAQVQLGSSTYSQFSHPINFKRTWIVLKQRFPLLGAQIIERDENSIFFSVDEERLGKTDPTEIEFRTISSNEEASELVRDLVMKQRALSNDLLARVFVLERTDKPDYFHLIIQAAHCITDGMSNITILKTFLHQLTQPTPPVPNLQERLALALSSEELVPQRKFSEARKRWRKAIAAVISSKNVFKRKLGHTLPRNISQLTPHTPARSRTLTYSFDPHTSDLIISTCRKHQLTFGNAYPIIGQIALTRVLLRRYLRNEIGKEEWQWRKREPMVSAGPLNLRPMLDPEWQKAGGLNNVCVSIGFFAFSLPFMPLGKATNIKPGMQMPPFEDLLSAKRFMHRAKDVKIQAAKFIKNPLFMEINSISAPGRIQRVQSAGIPWRNGIKAPKGLTDRLLSPQEQAANGLVFCNGGSSMGNVDLLLPLEYPIGKQRRSKAPLLELKNSATVLRCRPSELYLGASTSRQKLHIIVYWDNNVFDEDVVTEWMEEVRAAIDYYLGDGAQKAQGKL
ncbi:hypothetical protein CPC08DRAFT_687538 [Agrocybe pediades]|nr:hypothetical protein CPC08DRAFT_687538 [Agrocybe pediades]